jgi:hypothetical protein
VLFVVVFSVVAVVEVSDGGAVVVSVVVVVVVVAEDVEGVVFSHSSLNVLPKQNKEKSGCS